jgi:hypothetical protein
MKTMKMTMACTSLYDISVKTGVDTKRRFVTNNMEKILINMTATQHEVGVGSDAAKVVLDAHKIVASAAIHLQWCPILGVPTEAARASRCTCPCLQWLRK